MMRQMNLREALGMVLEHLSPLDLYAFARVSPVQNYLLLFSWIDMEQIWIRIQLRIQLLSSVTSRMQKKFWIPPACLPCIASTWGCLPPAPCRRQHCQLHAFLSECLCILLSVCISHCFMLSVLLLVNLNVCLPSACLQHACQLPVCLPSLHFPVC